MVPLLPDWLTIILLILGGFFLTWVLLLIITFIGLWALHPEDAHDINIEEKRKY